MKFGFPEHSVFHKLGLTLPKRHNGVGIKTLIGNHSPFLNSNLLKTSDGARRQPTVAMPVELNSDQSQDAIFQEPFSPKKFTKID